MSLSETSRWDAGIALRWSDNENQILGARIDTASRRLTVLDTYVRHARPVLGGEFDATLTLRNGLEFFGAFDDDDAPVGSPIAQYTAFLLDVLFRRPWQIGDQGVLLSSRVLMQHSDDNLFGSEQFSIGGFGSVRGSRTSVLFGNRGVQFINTLSAPNAWEFGENVALTPYIGLDAGHIFAQSEFGIAGGTLASYSVGITLTRPQFRVDALYSKVFSAPSAAQVSQNGLFTLQAQLTF